MYNAAHRVIQGSMQESMREQLRNLIDTKVIDRSYSENVFNPHPGSWIFDFRSILLVPEHLQVLVEALYDRIKDRDHYQIGGLESSAIPLITALVLRAHRDGKDVNGFYVRKSRKKQGLYKHIEGTLNTNAAIIVDDLIKSGESKLRVMRVLEEMSVPVETILTIARLKEQSAYRHFNEQGITVESLFTLDDFGLSLLNSGEQFLRDPYPRTLLHSPPCASYQFVCPKSTPAVENDGVFFGTDAGVFLALNADTGALKWKVQTGKHRQGKSIFSSPAISDGVVYFGSYDGKLYALDVRTGVPKWVYHEAEWIGSSPAVAADVGLVFVGLEHGLDGKRGSLAAVALESGKERWRVDMAAYTHASPLYIGVHHTVVCGGNDGILRAHNAENGSLLWQFQTEGGRTYDGISGFSQGDIKSAPVYDEATDSILFCATDGWCYSLARTDGTLRFRVHTEQLDTTARAGIYGAPHVADNRVFFGGTDKKIYCVRADTGQPVWQFETNGRIFATPVTVGDKVFVGSNDGTLYELSAADGAVRSKTLFSERITNPVVYDHARNALFLTTHTNQLYRLSLTHVNMP